MGAHLPTESDRPPRARSLAAHALGFFGANLAIGAVVLWWLPLLRALWQGGAAAPWGRLLLAPWSATGAVTAFAVLGDLAVVAAVVLGARLVGHAVRMLERASL
jgi:hypothetical protein